MFGQELNDMLCFAFAYMYDTKIKRSFEVICLFCALCRTGSDAQVVFAVPICFILLNQVLVPVVDLCEGCVTFPPEISVV